MVESVDAGGPDGYNVQMQWGVQIPLRDGVALHATLYRPRDCSAPSPVILAMTPYIAQSHHDIGVYFAARGYRFAVVDVRGRGNSEGVFKYSSDEARDGHDIVEWLAQQAYCDGHVAMWGGSYGGYAQWATASQSPPHLATIVPVASPFRGVDAPLHNNIFSPERLQWLTIISGRALQDKIFSDTGFWRKQFRTWFEAGRPFNELDKFLGVPSATFQEWLAHPHQDSYWDAYNPTAEQYATMSMPILTITGIYDVSQLGALAHYRHHLAHASAEACAQHYLVIGPWDHAGTRTPMETVGGLEIGRSGCIDLLRLHAHWYAWRMEGGERPAFLKRNVAYYVTGADEWRYADSLAAITVRSDPYFLRSSGNPTSVWQSGLLTADGPGTSGADHYSYDPRDISLAPLQLLVDPTSLIDQRLVYAAGGKHLVYHSTPFDEYTEISGFFRLRVWLSIDQPDTDFCVSIHDIGLDGTSVLLATDCLRARYRVSLREEVLIRTAEPLCYDFERFPFTARRIAAGHRLRLVIGPINSIDREKNYNSGGVVSEESVEDARTVTVRLFHDQDHPSALYVPFGQL